MVIAILIVIPEYWCDYSCLQRCLLAVWSMWYLATSRWPRICFSLPLTFFFCIFSLILVPPPPPSATNRNFHTSNKNANWQLHKLCLGPHIPQPVLVLTNQKKSSEGRSQSIQSTHGPAFQSPQHHSGCYQMHKHSCDITFLSWNIFCSALLYLFIDFHSLDHAKALFMTHGKPLNVGDLQLLHYDWTDWTYCPDSMVT